MRTVTAPVRSRLGRWLFADRRTGRIVVAQRPNLALWTFLVATAARYVLPRSLATGILAVVALGALAIWAIDEIVRGVNPWRRILGAAVLVVIAASAV